MWLYRVNHVVGQVIRPYWRLGLVGPREEIPPRGACLIAANHCSYLDPWFIGISFPRPISYLITARWYHRSPLWRALFKAWGTEPVREGRSRATIEAVCHVLARGGVTGIFPEGGISESGRLQPFRPGIARMAARSGALVLPMGIRGSFEAFPKSARFPKPARVKIHIGRSMRFPGAPYEGPPPRELCEAFTKDLRAQILLLSGATENPVHQGGRESEPARSA